MKKLIITAIAISFLSGCHKPIDKSVCWSEPTKNAIGERLITFATAHSDITGDVIDHLGLVTSGAVDAPFDSHDFYAVNIDENTAAAVCGFTFTSTIKDKGKDIVTPESRQVIFKVFQGERGATIDFDDSQLTRIIMALQPLAKTKVEVTRTPAPNYSP